jgi:hypothetical protein
MSTESCTEFPIDIRTRASYFLIFPRRHPILFPVLVMTIDTRTLVAPCGIAIPLPARRIARAADAATMKQGRCETTSHDVPTTNLQMGMTLRRENVPATRRVRRGISLADAARDRICRQDRWRTRACMSPRAQMMFDIQHVVPEHVRLPRAVSARRSHDIALTGYTATRRSDLRRMRGDWK